MIILPTTKQTIKEVFYSKIEQDESFFEYYNLTPSEAIELANKRADNLLRDAVAYFKSHDRDSGLDFTENENGDYEEDFTDVEIDLLAEIMNLLLFRKDYNRLKNLEVNFTPSDLKVFSPSESRRTFLDMYLTLKGEIDSKIRRYCDRDREDNKLITINYSAYET